MATGKIQLLSSEGGTNNADGGYCKLQDGTLIQWGKSTLIVNSSLSEIASSGVYTGRANFTLPQAFIDNHFYISGTIKFDTGYVIPAGSAAVNSNTVDVTIYDYYERPASSSYDTANYVYRWYAVGRWK